MLERERGRRHIWRLISDLCIVPIEGRGSSESSKSFPSLFMAELPEIVSTSQLPKGAVYGNILNNPSCLYQRNIKDNWHTRGKMNNE